MARAAARGKGDPTFDPAVGRVFQSALFGEAQPEGKQQGLTVSEIDEFPRSEPLSWHGTSCRQTADRTEFAS